MGTAPRKPHSHDGATSSGGDKPDVGIFGSVRAVGLHRGTGPVLALWAEVGSAAGLRYHHPPRPCPGSQPCSVGGAGGSTPLAAGPRARAESLSDPGTPALAVLCV